MMRLLEFHLFINFLKSWCSDIATSSITFGIKCFCGVAAPPTTSKPNSNYQMNCHFYSFLFFPNIVNLSPEKVTEMIKHELSTFEIFFFSSLLERLQPKRRPSLNAAREPYIRPCDHGLVIFHNHQTRPHPPPTTYS